MFSTTGGTETFYIQASQTKDASLKVNHELYSRIFCSTFQFTRSLQGGGSRGPRGFYTGQVLNIWKRNHHGRKHDMLSLTKVGCVTVHTTYVKVFIFRANPAFTTRLLSTVEKEAGFTLRRRAFEGFIFLHCVSLSHITCKTILTTEIILSPKIAPYS